LKQRLVCSVREGGKKQKPMQSKAGTSERGREKAKECCQRAKQGKRKERKKRPVKFETNRPFDQVCPLV
jgi:hypothetical protein